MLARAVALCLFGIVIQEDFVVCGIGLCFRMIPPVCFSIVTHF